MWSARKRSINAFSPAPDGGREVGEMNYIGNGIAFGCLCFSAAWLEISGKEAWGLWLLVVIWAVVGDFVPPGDNHEKSNSEQ